MINPGESILRHGSVVSIAGRAVLILGRSGAGKSGLALRLIGRGAALVADDQVLLERRGGALIASAPSILAGMIEMRGFGLMRLPYQPEAVVVAAVDLDVDPAARMPQRRTISFHEIEVQLIFARDMPNIDNMVMFVMHNTQRVQE